MNDYVWMHFHHQRENELRTAALRRGGDVTPVTRSASGLAGWLRLRLRRITSPIPTRAPAPTVATPVAAARRRSATPAPTPAALAWRRLASGAGTLEPAMPSSGELERDAA